MALVLEFITVYSLFKYITIRTCQSYLCYSFARVKMCILLLPLHDPCLSIDSKATICTTIYWQYFLSDAD